MENKIFNQDINIVRQNVKIIQYFSNFNQDIDFSNLNNLNLDYNYNILNRKENNRDHIIILEFNISNFSDKENKQKNILNLVVEGNYIINDNIQSDKLDGVKQFGSLSLIVNFLRTTLYNITSMTSNGGVYLPLINISELHKKKKVNKKKVKLENE